MDEKKPDIIKKWWLLIVLVCSTLSGLGVWLFQQGQYSLITFDDPEQKVEHETHIKLAPHPIQFQMEAQADSAFRKEVRQFIHQQSIDNRDMKRHIHNIDSVQWLNADQQYQIKRELEELKNNN